MRNNIEVSLIYIKKQALAHLTTQWIINNKLFKTKLMQSLLLTNTKVFDAFGT